MKTTNRKSNAAKTVVVITALFVGVLSACTQKGAVTSDGASSVSGSIAVTKPYPTSEGSGWTPITLASRYYLKGLDVSVLGTCPRGVATIKVNEGGPDYAQTATCLVDGSFVWSKTYTAVVEEGDKSLVFQAYDIADVAISGAVTIDVRVDATAPGAPVITDPAADPYIFPGSASPYTIQGTADADVVRLSGPAGVAIIPSALAWTYDATITAGSSTDFSFYAYDLAGNQSPPSIAQTITWNPSLTPRIAGPYLGGPVTDSGTNYSLEFSGSAEPAFATDSGTSYEVLTGFNSVTNKVRAD